MRASISTLAIVASLSLSACGGGGSSSALPAPSSPTSAPLTTASAPCPVAHCVTIVIPAAASVRTQSLKPKYISPSTASARITVADVIAGAKRADGLLTGSPLNGYPMIVALGNTTPGCVTDAGGAMTCTIPLPGIERNGVGYGFAASILDGGTGIVGTAVASPTNATIDTSGNPTAFVPLDFGTVTIGGNNFANAPITAVIGQVRLTQPTAIVETKAASMQMGVAILDHSGNPITGSQRFASEFGVLADVRFTVPPGKPIGGGGNIKVSNVYSVAYSCPAGDPNGAGPQPALLDATCTATLAYSGGDVALPNVNAAQNGLPTIAYGNDFNVIVTAAGVGRSYGTFFPITKPVTTLAAPFAATFATSPNETISYADLGFGIRTQAYSNRGAPGFWAADDCNGIATVTVVDESKTTISPNIAKGACIASSVLYEQNVGTSNQVVQRESEQIPVLIGGATPVNTAVQMTPSVAMLATSTSAATMRLSQYADPALGSLAYSVTVPYCVQNVVTFPVGGFGNLVSNKASALALFPAPGSFVLTGTAHQDVLFTQNSVGNPPVMCEVDVAPDFGPPSAPSLSESTNTGAKYFVVSSF